MLKLFHLVTLLLFISACKPIEEQRNASNQLALKSQCIASQSQCQISTEWANFTVKFSQHQLADKIKTELPFDIELIAHPVSADKEEVAKSYNLTNVSAYIEGKDMFMGKLPVFFEQMEGGRYIAESFLASCSEEQMVWRLWITAESSDQQQAFFIDFTSQRL